MKYSRENDEYDTEKDSKLRYSNNIQRGKLMDSSTSIAKLLSIQTKRVESGFQSRNSYNSDCYPLIYIYKDGTNDQLKEQ